jgi:DtxR family Mn-dependent transcriptional regulator
MSESEEMYLVSIARLIEEGVERPVPLSQLADEMDIAPVSANQMIRKLEEAGLVSYIPYKGADLTPEGQQLALSVIRHRRLWEVFLVEHLKFTPAQAESLACRLEHVLPEEAAERLTSFLGHPLSNPQGKFIPPAQPGALFRPGIALSRLMVDLESQILAIETDLAARDFLASQGVLPGKRVLVLARSGGGDILVETGNDKRISVSEKLASQIWVEDPVCAA